MICTYIYLSHRCYMHIVFLLASNKCLRVVMQLEKREETTTSSLFIFCHYTPDWRASPSLVEARLPFAGQAGLGL